MNKLSTKKFFINKIRSGDIKHITIYGSSILPTFSSGETIEITKDIEIKTGNIVVAINNKSDNFVVHRIVDINNSNKEVCLLGDNQTNSEKCWLPISSLIAQAKEHAHLNKKNLNFNLVCDIPFNKPKYFNEPTYQVFQSLKMKDYDSYYFDYNIQFNLKLYDEEKVQDYKNCSKIEFNNFMNYFKLVRDIAARKYNLYKFTFGELVLCNPAESEEIKHIIDNYKETIYYSFYKEKIIKLKNFIKTKNKNFKPVKVYLVVNNFNKLISSIIFAKTCNEILSIKPILVNKSPIFDGRFDTRYYEQFFLKIISIAEINKDINNLNSDYSQINFDDYITPFKIAPITIREECYYKKCSIECQVKKTF